MLLSQTDTSLLVAINIGQSGFPYADAAENLELYEYRLVDPASKRVGVRVSMKIKWLNKPLIIWQLFDEITHTKIGEAVEYFMDF
jgi:hypothetical protein